MPCFRPMRVPLLDLAEQYRLLAEPIRAELEDILASQKFILGSKGEELEGAIAQYCGTSHALGVSSGTDALLVILMALGIGPGDAVITSPFTFFATAGCIARVGATPIFVDIAPSTYNLSADALERYLKQCHRVTEGSLVDPQGRKIRAVIPVHLYGLCCEMSAILEIAERFRLEVIEDAAQAIGAECPFHGTASKAGSMAEVGFFSFYPSKNLGAAGDAGMVICRTKELAGRLKILRQHGMEPRYYHHVIGGNFRLDEIQAAILNVKLPYLGQWSAARRRIADIYREAFTARRLTDHVTLPAEPYRERGFENHHIYHQYVIRTPERDALRKHLAEKEIGTAIYYPLGLHQQPCFAYLGYHEGDFPETEKAAKETLALPIYPELTREAQRYVADAVAEFFAKK